MNVGIFDCADYEVARLQEVFHRAFELFGGVEAIIKPGEQVLLKPNFICSSRKPGEPACTDPGFIFAAAMIVKDCGAHPIVGDSPAFGTVSGILRKSGWLEKYNDAGIELREFKHPRRGKSAGEKFRHFIIDRTLTEVDKIINLPKMKVHCQIVMTGAVKNMFGCVPGKRKAWRHMSLGGDSAIFGRMIVETYLQVRPHFNLVDAVEVMETLGPTGGNASKAGLVLAGTDGMAVDTVLAEIFGFEPEQVPVLSVCRKIGGGVTDLGEITIAGDYSKIPHHQIRFADPRPLRFSLVRVIKSAMRHLWTAKVKDKQD